MVMKLLLCYFNTDMESEVPSTIKTGSGSMWILRISEKICPISLYPGTDSAAMEEIYLFYITCVTL